MDCLNNNSKLCTFCTTINCFTKMKIKKNLKNYFKIWATGDASILIWPYIYREENKKKTSMCMLNLNSIFKFAFVHYLNKIEKKNCWMQFKMQLYSSNLHGTNIIDALEMNTTNDYTLNVHNYLFFSLNLDLVQ